ncbi:MAG: phosphatase PAP2 family protein [Candidatus Abawacabacteria bacterium]|nr:phosphatase PAP2 family protein [Candidatus Abawacabacteria bacterium]
MRKLKKWLLSAKKPIGLYLTLGLSFALIGLLYFAELSEHVSLHRTWDTFDNTVLQSIKPWRNPYSTLFFSFITFLANSQTAIFLSALTILLCLYTKQYFTTLIFAIGLLGSGESIFWLKNLIGRQRPDIALQFITENSFSFPSGHMLTATVLFGLITYLLIRSSKKLWSKAINILGYIITVSLVGFSRMYFGVHYPSDILGSALVGGSWLSVIITALELNNHYHIFGAKVFKPSKLFFLLPIAAFLFSLLLHSTFIQTVS